MKRKRSWEVRFDKALLDIPRDVLPMKGKMVYIILCAHADGDGVSFPSVGRIADAASCCRNVVTDALRSLCDLGLIERWQESSKSGQSVNYYRVLAIPESMGVHEMSDTQEMSDAQDMGDPIHDMGDPAHDMGDHAHDMDGGCSSDGHPSAHLVGDPHPSAVHYNNVFNNPNITDPILTSPVRTEKSDILSEIISLWNEKLAPLGITPVRQVTEARSSALSLRVSEAPERASLDWWRECFIGKIASSTFLRENGVRGRWLTFDWALNERHFVGIIEGKYDDREQVQNFGIFEELSPEELERENEYDEILALLNASGFPGDPRNRSDLAFWYKDGQIDDATYERAIRFIERYIEKGAASHV